MTDVIIVGLVAAAVMAVVWKKIRDHKSGRSGCGCGCCGGCSAKGNCHK